MCCDSDNRKSTGTTNTKQLYIERMSNGLLFIYYGFTHKIWYLVHNIEFNTLTNVKNKERELNDLMEKMRLIHKQNQFQLCFIH